MNGIYRLKCIYKGHLKDICRSGLSARKILHTHKIECKKTAY
ncbi:hypothetical protein [Helicobacter turcicus]|nr:hypothetical protein [Helicobacter turcicus]